MCFGHAPRIGAALESCTIEDLTPEDLRRYRDIIGEYPLAPPRNIAEILLVQVDAQRRELNGLRAQNQWLRRLFQDRGRLERVVRGVVLGVIKTYGGHMRETQADVVAKRIVGQLLATLRQDAGIDAKP